MKHTMTLTALSAALLVSTAAYAANTTVSSKATIGTLPEKGAVSLSGTVDRVVDGDTFILRDSADKTIDVHTASNVTVKKGDHVSVKGEKTAELAGMGEEINKATVTVGTHMASNSDMKTMETPYAAKNNTDPQKPAAYDLDADIDVSAEKVADAGEVTAREATIATATDMEADVDTSITNDTIANLPKEGSVELNGVVAEVDSPDNFTLRDAAGKTIEVQTASNVEVAPGDTVSVNGNVKSKLLGLGRQIESAKVIVVSAAN